MALAKYAHERRVQRYAIAALVAAVVFALIELAGTSARILGVDLPALVPLGLLGAGALVGLVAILRRSGGLALAGAGVTLLAMGVSLSTATILDYALALAFALATLAWVELVHVTERYERAHRVVEREHVSEESLNRVTDETLKTLGTRASLAALVVAAGAGLAFLLRAVGPRQWREAVETTAPLGVTLVTLAILGALSLTILFRGARLRAPSSPAVATEVDPDAAE